MTQINFKPIFPSPLGYVNFGNANKDLNEDNFEHITVSVKNHEIQSFKPLIERIEDDKIDNLIEASKSG